MRLLKIVGSRLAAGWRVIVLVWLALCLPAAGAQAPLKVELSQARFQGLTRIVLRSSVPLDGIGMQDVLIRRKDGAAVAAGDIQQIVTAGHTLTIVIRARVFARVDSDGSTVATRAFDRYANAAPVRIARAGEPARNGHLVGTSGWTDEGWDTAISDPAFVDANSGQHGLHRFSDTKPDRDADGRPVLWRDGAVRTPAHRAKTMLVLFVEFPDRKAADATPPYRQFGQYLHFLQPATHWFDTASYGQFQLSFAAPQHSRKLEWLTMSKNAQDYKWGGDAAETGDMFNYCREALQLAYDRYGIRADAYDLLLIIPAQGLAGLPNGPANINDQYMGQTVVPSRTVLVERGGKAHTIDTFVTAGNDLFYWGYRWLIHEMGHTFGLPDLYMYQPKIKGVEVDRFFYVGGWDIMGNIGGQSNDFLAWHKWKLRWIRDDQVDVVSSTTDQPSVHALSPIESPGGSKMVVVRTGLSTAYVAEFRTALGVNGLDAHGRDGGVLIYRLDTGPAENGERPLLQVISRQYYSNPEVSGGRNLTGVWRPLDKSVDGMGQGAAWQAGEVFSDPATGVTIQIDRIGQATEDAHGAPDARNYTEDDVALLRVSKRGDAQLSRRLTIQEPILSHLTHLRFRLNVASAPGEMNWFVRQRTRLAAADIRLQRANGQLISVSRVRSFNQDEAQVMVTLKAGTFRDVSDAEGLQLLVLPHFDVAGVASTPVKIAP